MALHTRYVRVHSTLYEVRGTMRYEVRGTSEYFLPGKTHAMELLHNVRGTSYVVQGSTQYLVPRTSTRVNMCKHYGGIPS